MLIRQKRTAGGQPYIGVLDIGTSKVCSIVAAAEPQARGQAPGYRILGIGHQRSRGIKAGVIVDLDEAEQAVRAAVSQSERMAGVQIDEVLLAVCCGRLLSRHFTANAVIEGGVVTDRDVGRAEAAGRAWAEKDGGVLVHMGRLGFRLDGQGQIQEPRGLSGRQLSLQLHAVTADDAPLRNLVLLVERCHLAVGGLVPAGLASGLAVTTEEERRLGTMVVEMGAGLTSFAAFADGRLVHIDSVPIGGNHVTYDIARELVTTVQEAERIKTLYGTLVKAASNDGEVFAYPVVGDDEGAMHQASKALIREVVKPRIDGLVDLIAERMAEAGLEKLAVRRVVLTGGASQLIGLDQAWSARLGCLTRIGRPQPIGRMPTSMCSAAFATVIGLVYVGAEPKAEVSMGGGSEIGRRERGYIDRMQRWIRESF